MQINRESLLTGLESWTAHRIAEVDAAASHTIETLERQIANSRTVEHPGHHATVAQPEILSNTVTKPALVDTAPEFVPITSVISTPESRADAARRQIEAIQGGGQPAPVTATSASESSFLAKIEPELNNQYIESIASVVPLFNDQESTVKPEASSTQEPIRQPEPIASFAEYLRSQQQGLKDAA